MKIIITKNHEEMSRKAAALVASQMILKPESVLGFATGSTPEGMYQKLIEANKKGDIDFSKIKTFNLDEYYGLEKENPQSYYYFMQDKLFNHVNMDPQNTHIPNGMAEDTEKECREYEEKIEKAGGIDLQILGIGNNSHIGFNEPDTEFVRDTHLVGLNEDTIQANARFFESEEEVPTQALTMGIGTIMKSKKIVLMASGKGKADAIYNTVKGEISPEAPSSILQLHRDVILVIDQEAASKL
ncbi:glucosamine-6-phosphate deaminase [Irregularibacter muris]|uniref:Glucosamine-6-phosphate deaminase n=1 Tax=Irregularibacter muris TaxID=1796619 RepID=A0AAE3HDB3_9FIRM|nr:glucosamine-6-phosphate deaminase [Irregularibacter muris]MCR1898296.1 glucosamine-6-phosphate deaminase [Irregularibacter muris]